MNWKKNTFYKQLILTILNTTSLKNMRIDRELYYWELKILLKFLIGTIVPFMDSRNKIFLNNSSENGEMWQNRCKSRIHKWNNSIIHSIYTKKFQI